MQSEVNSLPKQNSARLGTTVRAKVAVRNFVKKLVGKHPLVMFSTWHYARYNYRRLEHLSSLQLPLANKTVLEVGAGIGDITHFFLDRGCKVSSIEGRKANFEILASRYADIEPLLLDLETPDLDLKKKFDVVLCYGLLYHLSNPVPAIKFMANHCKGMLLLETCVSMGEGSSINPCSEHIDQATQALSGTGCRPTRRWIFDELKKYFPHVYMPLTQPYHLEFPIDWTTEKPPGPVARSVFIASHQEIDSPVLVKSIPMKQRGH